MARLPQEQVRLLEGGTPRLALDLLKSGIPVFWCHPQGESSIPPPGWQTKDVDWARDHIGRFKYGRHALAMCAGHGIDVIDLDSKHGVKLEDLPPRLRQWGYTRTPSGGYHVPVPGTGYGQGNIYIGGKHVGEFAGGTEQGGGRRLIFLPGSHRPKYPDSDYVEVVPWDLDRLLTEDPPSELVTWLDECKLTKDARPGSTAASKGETAGWMAAHQHPVECRYGRTALESLLKEADELTGSRHEWAVRSYTRACELMISGCLSSDDLTVITSKFAEIKPEADCDEAERCLQWGLGQARDNLDNGIKLSGCKEHAFSGWFWHRRDYLAWIQQEAYDHMVSPWALLVTAITRTAAQINPEVTLPSSIGSNVGLSIYAGIVGESGSGKSAAIGVCEDMFPWTVSMSQIGSGEGLIKTFVHKEKQDGQWVQVQHATQAYIAVDEISSLLALTDRQGATLEPMLNSLWLGKGGGFGYADQEKRVSVEAHTYQIGMVVGIQPAKSDKLLRAADAGTPQRFLFASAYDPTVPAQYDANPGSMPWRVGYSLTDRSGRGQILWVKREILDEIREHRHRVLTRQTDDEGRGHELMLRLKVAAILAIWNGMMGVGLDDWDLAGAIVARSNLVRQSMEETLILESARQRDIRAKGQAHVARVVKSELENHDLDRVAQKVSRKVIRDGCEGGCPRVHIKNAMNSADRKKVSVSDAIDYALGREWLARTPDGKYREGPSWPF